MNKHDKKLLAQKYQREFEIALVKICLVSASIGFAAGIAVCTVLMFMVK